MYVARNKNGFLWLFNAEPTREEHCFVNMQNIDINTWNCVELNRHSFPEVTWENSPKKVVLEEYHESNREKAEKLLVDEGFFYITSVHRNDLEGLGFDISEVTDDQMKILAKQMSNDYCNQLFHISLEILAEGLGIPKKEKQNQ